MQPDTVIGRRLADRALHLAATHHTRPAVPDGILDLTTPVASAPPASVREAAKAAMNQGETHYTSAGGILPLRTAIAEWLTADGFPSSADTVVVTNGASEALYIALQSSLAPAVRVATVGPFDASVTDLIAFNAAEHVPLPVRARERFVPAIADIEASEATVLLLASPSPVTGVALPPSALAQAIDAGLRGGMTVIVDRSLAWCCYDPASARLDDPDLGARVLTVGSFSTAFDMAGWRVGYLSASADRLAAMHELKQSMSICTSTIGQFAGLAAVEASEEWLHQRRHTLADRLAWVQKAIGGALMTTIQPDAWPFLLLDTRLIHPDDRQAAAMIAKDAGVAVEPASAFGAACAGYVRIRLDVDDATLRSGVERMLEFHNTCH
jgi:aspartate/methionine/tyrosine aminotransferase